MNPYDTLEGQPNIPGKIGFWTGVGTLLLFLALVSAINIGLGGGIFGAGLIVFAIFIMFANIFVALIGFIVSLIGLLIPMAKKRQALLGFLFNTVALLGPFVLAVLAINKFIAAITTMGGVVGSVVH